MIFRSRRRRGGPTTTYGYAPPPHAGTGAPATANTPRHQSRVHPSENHVHSRVFVHHLHSVLIFHRRVVHQQQMHPLQRQHPHTLQLSPCHLFLVLVPVVLRTSTSPALFYCSFPIRFRHIGTIPIRSTGGKMFFHVVHQEGVEALGARAVVAVIDRGLRVGDARVVVPHVEEVRHLCVEVVANGIRGPREILRQLDGLCGGGRLVVVVVRGGALWTERDRDVAAGQNERAVLEGERLRAGSSLVLPFGLHVSRRGAGTRQGCRRLVVLMLVPRIRRISVAAVLVALCAPVICEMPARPVHVHEDLSRDQLYQCFVLVLQRRFNQQRKFLRRQSLFPRVQELRLHLPHQEPKLLLQNPPLVAQNGRG
mmetsp:Transcript_16396/g.40501  ORF Transcript_16396/g.40501 Transcript_16396/m.40501 type:complete len:367 (-) Transcript_16396:894-1994(-)